MQWLRNWLANREPFYFENSRVPVWLSKIAPIEIGAINIGFLVFSRGQISKTTRRHEKIHYIQQIELLFVLHWILYGAFWLIGLVRYRDGAKAYREIPFEREAYANQKKYTYFQKRPFWNWVNYIKVQE
jgi:hypothetical protein